jgi:5-methylcytosine-specific restriction protein A
LDLDAFRSEEEFFEEGKQKKRFTNYYERNPKLRTAAIQYHGTRCMACGFDFEKVYGKHGTGYIEVHHLLPVSSLKMKTKVDPKTDMAVVCSNCHRMIHRKKDTRHCHPR